MTNKNQTAVEYLYEMLEGMIPRTILYSIDKKIYFQQALEMEKQQIIKAHKDSAMFEMDSDKYAEQYYKETYQQ